VEVEFFDYGNIDLVSLGDVYRKLSSVPLARPGEEITVDPDVCTGQGEEDLVVDQPVLIDHDQCHLSVKVCVGSGGFAVRDKKGIMMFNTQGKLLMKLEVDKLDTCGMAVDNLGRIVIHQ
jgi:hypothetical protein